MIKLLANRFTCDANPSYPPPIPRPRTGDSHTTAPKRGRMSRCRQLLHRNATVIAANLIAFTAIHGMIATGAHVLDAYHRHWWPMPAIHLTGTITAATIGTALVVRGMLTIPPIRAWSARHLSTRGRNAAIRRAQRHLNNLDFAHITATNTTHRAPSRPTAR